MAETQLVLIPSPGAGHLFAAVELAKLLVGRHHSLSIVVLVMSFPSDLSKGTASATSDSFASAVDPTRVRFIDLPLDDTFHDTTTSNFLLHFIENNRANVTRCVAGLVAEWGSASTPTPRRLGGFVLDMFCTAMIEVADSFGVPSYTFFTCNAAFLELMFDMQEQTDRQGKNMLDYKDSKEEYVFRGFSRRLPASVLPSIVLVEETVDQFLQIARSFRRANGIIVNTFLELEQNTIKFLQSDPDMPKVYPVGPILNIGGIDDARKLQDANDVLKWLDEQPTASVVFLCFGSMGSFGKDQVREIAAALENSGHRFLWSLRRPPPQGKVGYPSDYGEEISEVLPEGFLERTAGVGKVIGWAPQAKILAHPSTGGFVSHCGWNSTLESIYFGVPMATWPLYAEQQFNAFHLTRELGLAAEIRIDYRKEFRMESKELVTADEIEGGIRELMEEGGEKRRKVKELSEICRGALKEGGSSYLAFGELISDLLAK
ncbi:hypothetical protein MLD38_023967 [Melastoma candidum]|uniref:Uncharacterized protein n=1 Tax=Melastoma candidum TaxID=119954 RepID=A0ACB9NRV5_9MYRT|nr:hypothetical protein MLD38_023967 [Melastoma candidum]